VSRSNPLANVPGSISSRAAPVSSSRQEWPKWVVRTPPPWHGAGPAGPQSRRGLVGRGEAGAPLAVEPQAPLVLQGAAGGVGDRPADQARGGGRGGVAGGDADVGGGQPQGQGARPGPRGDARGGQRVRRDGDALQVRAPDGGGDPVEDRAERGPGAAGVERAGAAPLARVHDPGGEVADVDDLQGLVGRVRHHRPAAAGEPRRPVAEPVAAVAGPADQPGPHHERPVARGGPHGVLEATLIAP
jgi:hypothetical protein